MRYPAEVAAEWHHPVRIAFFPAISISLLLLVAASSGGASLDRRPSGSKGSAVYDGYASCPPITRVGKAMLVEFDYHNKL